jgi:4-amino-4-deoxy-L-arabinose transferase-like glycosyltransferase
MLEILLGLWQFFAVFSAGLAIERRVGARLPYGYRVAVAFGLGETVISCALFLLGIVGGLRGAVLVPLAILVTILLGPGCIRELRRIGAAARPHILRAPVTSLIIAFGLGVFALGTGVPEREFDALWYHLAVPYYYISHGGFIQAVAFNLPSHYPMYGQLHFAFSLIIGNDSTAKVFAFCHFLPMLVLLWSVIKRYGKPGWGLLAVAIYLSCIQFRLPVMANVQRAVYFYVFLSWVMLWEAVERNDRKLMILSAVFCGMAMGTKQNAVLYAFAGQVVFLFGWTAVRPKERFRSGLGRLVILAGVGFLFLLPWTAKAWIDTGNPVFPMFSNVFPVHPELEHALGEITGRQGISLLACESVSGVAGNLVRNVSAFLYGSDVVFPVGLLTILVLLFLRPGAWRFPAASAAISYLLLILYWGADPVRLFGATYGVVIAVIVLTAAAIAEPGAVRPRLARLVYPLLLLGVTLSAVKFHALRLRENSTRWGGEVCLTERSREAWLAGHGVVSPAYIHMKHFIEGHVPEDDTVFGYRADALFHLEHKNIEVGVYFLDPVGEWLERSSSFALERLDDLGVRWILWDEERVGNESPDVRERFREMLDEGFEEAHRTGDLVLHRRKIDPAAGRI